MRIYSGTGSRRGSATKPAACFTIGRISDGMIRKTSQNKTRHLQVSACWCRKGERGKDAFLLQPSMLSFQDFRACPRLPFPPLILGFPSRCGGCGSEQKLRSTKYARLPYECGTAVGSTSLPR